MPAIPKTAAERLRAEYEKFKPQLEGIAHAHLDSFNWALTDGLKALAKWLPRYEIAHKDNVIEISYTDFKVKKPETPISEKRVDARLFPWECRSAGKNYAGQISATVIIKIRDKDGSYSPSISFERVIGELPIMVKSQFCNLQGADPEELIKRNEEPYDFGGYFVANGNAKLIRMLIANRRNYPMAIYRDSYTKVAGCSNMGILTRCVREDQSAHVNNVIYKNDGTIMMTFGSRRFLFPVTMVLKALKNVSDKEIYQRILASSSQEVDSERVQLCLQELKAVYGVQSQQDALTLIGKFFKPRLTGLFLSPVVKDEEVGRHVLQHYVLPHLTNSEAKFDALIFIIQKLLKFVNKEIVSDDIDSIANQEALLPGHVYLNNMKATIYINLVVMAKRIQGYIAATDKRTNKASLSELAQKGAKLFTMTISAGMGSFISSGTLVFGSGLNRIEAPQYNGYTVAAENINFFRYISHFTSIHRGSYFQEQKTTAVRKLRSEQWGFICPVNTPDGGPCGLLNHLTHLCRVSCVMTDPALILPTLFKLGVSAEPVYSTKTAPVFVNGTIVGSIPFEKLESVAEKLRYLKATGELPDFELGHIPYQPKLYPLQIPTLGIYTDAARFMRPVKNLLTNTEERIGPMEQLFLNIGVTADDYKKGITTHMELGPTAILSVVANLTPFSDFNQSPRNVYQCQMGKQTMGVPAVSMQHVTEGKLYRIITPQQPLSRTQYQDSGYLPYNTYLTGANAIVAVLSYTGYDMEDAMIINKSSWDRGFGNGTVYKTMVYDLMEETGKKMENEQAATETPYFSRKGLPAQEYTYIGPDGIPEIGARITNKQPIVAYFDPSTKKFTTLNWKEKEPGYVDSIRILSSESAEQITKIRITFRLNRRPTIGDKFSSRHGQKGVLSILWPQEDMPFTEVGMTPDVIINPHAFPSRMTIGMLVESMASKAGALHGVFQDATPFQFDEKQKAVDYFGEQLLKAGYNYYGNEVMYSGSLGVEFKADIFIGCVYYQRLRHMVLDKYQVRAHDGPKSNTTKQPLKGRKKGGGIRVGEMERDALLSYGAAYMVRDRLYHCSDEDWQFVCKKCGGFLSISSKKHEASRSVQAITKENQTRVEYKSYECRLCKTGKHVDIVGIPYVFKLLANELASMNIKLKLGVEREVV